MIELLELQNWKTHGSSTLSFSKGTNILLGQMGAGKSSVMDAISFALFGTFPAIKNRRMSINDVISNRPVPKDRAVVRLKFRLGNDIYTVEREVALNNSPKAKFEKNGVHVQSQPQRVTEEIERLLKIDYDLFSRVVYSEQNRLDYFLELKSADRKKQIDNLLGLDKFAVAQDNVTSLINRIKSMIEEEEKALEGIDMKELELQLANSKESLEKIVTESKKLKKEHDESVNKREMIESRYKKAKDLLSKKIALSKEIVEDEGKISTLNDEIKKIDKLELGSEEELSRKFAEFNLKSVELKKEENIVTDRMQEVQLRMGKLQNQISDLERKKTTKEKLLADMKDIDKAEFSKRFDDSKLKYEELEKELALVKVTKKENEKWITELEKHISKCPVCERNLDSDTKEGILGDKRKHVLELSNKENEIEVERRQLKSILNGVEEKLSQIKIAEEKLLEYGDVEKRLEEAGKLEKKSSEELMEIKIKRDEISKKREEQTREILSIKSSLDQITRKNSYIKNVREIFALVAEKKSKLGEIKIDDEEIDKMQKELVDINSLISRNLAILESSERERREKESRIEEKSKEIDRVRKLIERIKSRNKTVDGLTKFKNALQETQVVLRNKLVNSVNEVMQDIWPDLYPYGDYMGINLQATEGDYVLRVKTDKNGEGWNDVDSIASGGERSTACLTMRIAFAMVLTPNLKWIILDEPTHNIDQQGITKLVRLFSEVLPEIIEQIFIITHDEQLKQITNGKIYMLKRNKTESGATEIDEV